jgi:hypothetical protein
MVNPFNGTSTDAKCKQIPKIVDFTDRRIPGDFRGGDVVKTFGCIA